LLVRFCEIGHVRRGDTDLTKDVGWVGICVQWSEIRTANEDVTPIGKTAPENDQEDYEPDAEDEDADNVEEESEGEEFEQEAN
jgi:hypothetical protein